MKNNIKRITSLVLCMVLCLSVFAGCAQTNNGGTTVTSEKDTPITLGHVGIEGMIQARAGDTTGYTGNMWVYTKSATNSGEKYNSEKVLWTVTDGVPTLDPNATPTLYTGIEGDQTLWAITGFNENSANKSTYSVWPLFVSSTFKAEDRCYAKITLDGADAGTLVFRHLLTKLTVNIEFGSELSYEKNFKNTHDGDGVTLTGLLSEVNVDLSGVDSPVSPAADATFDAKTKMYYNSELDGVSATTGKPRYSHEALVCPSAGQKEVGITVKLTVNGEERYFTTTFQPQRTENGVTIYGFEAGYHYTVNVKVGKDKIEVTSINAEENPWYGGWGANDTELN